MNIIKSSTEMRLKPFNTSPLETECLYGETVDIIENESEWLYCKLLTDNYCGWVKKKDLGKLNKPTHKVISLRTFVFEQKNPKSFCYFYLPLGSKVAINSIENDWAEISLDKRNDKIGFVPSSHIVELNYKCKDWVAIAEQLVEVPYKWGGRDTVGIDCSALIQLSYQSYGKNIPRNTVDQVKIKKQVIFDEKMLKRGCAIFWSGHVALMVDNENCLHANAYHMKTVIEPLEIVKKRMRESHKILKMIDLN